jgi:hypothetical protein
MTRPLLLIAGCGFVAALVSFAIAFALGPVDWADWSWDGPGFRDRGPPVYGEGPTVTRQLSWPGGETLSIAVPASVTYTQGAESRITVTGPKGAVDHLIVDDGRLRFDRRVRRVSGLQVAMTAPDVREFNLYGSQRLQIRGYDQDRLEVKVFGSSDTVAEGRARSVEIHIAGSGDVDLGAVEADDGEVHIAGSGKAVLSPKLSADIHIAGSGDVVLTTRPQHLEQQIAGSGRIVQGEARPAPGREAPTAPRAP